MGAESFTTIPIEPFSHWAMDLIGPLPRSRSGNSWIVTWVDRTSKWIVARAMKTGSCSGKDLAELTFAEICWNYGLPARLTHDNDVRFKKFWRSLWTLVGTKITATAAWNPQADPAERANRRRNPGEPIILVLYGPWHLFFALFLEMVISGYR
jgi:hypothetical protein